MQKIHNVQKMQEEQIEENLQNVENVTIPSVAYQLEHLRLLPYIKKDENYAFDPFTYKLEPRKFKVMSDEKRFCREGFQRREKVRIPNYFYEDHINKTMYENELLYDPDSPDVVDSKANYKLFTYYFDTDLNTLLPDIHFQNLKFCPLPPIKLDSKGKFEKKQVMCNILKSKTESSGTSLEMDSKDSHGHLSSICILKPAETTEQISVSCSLKLTTTGFAWMKNNPLPLVKQTIKNLRETHQKLTNNEEGELKNGLLNLSSAYKMRHEKRNEKKDDFDPFSYKMEPKKFKIMSDEKRFSREGFERKKRSDHLPVNQL